MTVPVALLVDEMGWRSALRVLAVVVLVAGSLAGINVRRRPAGHRQPMDGLAAAPGGGGMDGEAWGIPARRAVRTRAFLLLALGLIANGFGWTALIVHQVPFMESLGVSKAEAGSTVLAFALASIVGRLAGGWLADRYEKRVVLAWAIALMAVGDRADAARPYARAELPGHADRRTGLRRHRSAPPGAARGLLRDDELRHDRRPLRLWVTIGSFGGPLTVGLIVDAGGGYTPGWLIAAAVVAAGIPLVLAAHPPSELIARYRRPSGRAAGRGP